MSRTESAEEAYDRYAGAYDEANAENDYEMWLGEKLLPRLEELGLRKGRALDVGCGTGRAFDPLLKRDWELVGCDVSRGMLREARQKFGSRVRLLEADARSLPPISPAPGIPAGEAFDLILLLNDVVNYMVDDGDLEKVFAGVRGNLREQGLALFDANTLALFREHFGAGVAEEIGVKDWEWRGLAGEAEPGLVYEAEVSGEGIETHLHRQRHWLPAQVEEALEATGLRCLAALGQREDRGQVILSESVDETRDTKVVYVAAR
jgi:SAM-dependent methyltransferase